MEAGGLVFLAGQTPRDRDNVRHGDKPFAVQARMALDNLEAAANAAGLSLKDAVRVGVFLRNPADAKEFDAIYREYVVGAVSGPRAHAVELRRIRHRSRRDAGAAVRHAFTVVASAADGATDEVRVIGSPGPRFPPTPRCQPASRRCIRWRTRQGRR